MKTQNVPTAFDEMPLTPQILRAIDEIGYAKPTNIQANAIPLLLENHDLIGRSCTGSGKTAAFAIPAIEGIDTALDQVQVLVLSPTRELAMQIYDEMMKFAKYKKNASLAVVYGGAPYTEQIKQLRKAQIVIGTPGRLMDHMRRRTLKLDHIRTVVLDEADEMLNMGFIDDIETIMTKVPEDRQTVLFSATMSASLRKISNAFLTNPLVIDTMSEKESQADIEQTFYQVQQKNKKDVLTLLMHANEQRCIIFSNTKSMVDELAEMLRKQGFKAAGLHGDMTQGARSQVMQGFRNGDVHVLVATDVAARGIDVDDVDVVINYDLPQTFEYYVHRIGRTGRAGRTGLSQTLVCNGKQFATLRSLMKYTGKDIAERKLPTNNEIMDKAVTRTAEEVFEQAKTQPGKSAQKLVESLLENEAFDGSTEQVAFVLAEMLMGGDEQFDRLKDAGIPEKKASQKKPFKQTNGKAPSGNSRKNRRRNFPEQRSSKPQGKRKPQSQAGSKAPNKAKKQRSRAYQAS